MPRSKSFSGLFVLVSVLALSLAACASDWSIQTRKASVELVPLSSSWRTCTVTFNSGPYTKARIYLGAYGATSGHCWIDNLKPSGFVIENPSFEKLTADGAAPAGWTLDSAGKLTHVVSDRASDGGHSMMYFDASGKASMTRMWQIVDVQPKTDYSYTYDIWMDSDYNSGIRCSVVAEAPEYYFMGGMKEDLDQDIADRSRVGNWHQRMKLDGGDASMTRTVRVPANAIMEAVANVKIKKLSGTMKYTVEDASTGKVLGSITETSGNGHWNLVSIRFTSPSEKVILRVLGEGTGEVFISGVDVLRPRLVPEPQKIAWRNAARSMRLKSELSYSLAGDTGELLNEGIQLLAKDLAAGNIRLVKVEGKAADLVISVGQGSKAPKDRGPESYYLNADKRGINIQSETDRGALYGVMTLLQLLADDNDGKSVIIGCEITDWPDFPWRSIVGGTRQLGGAKGPEWMIRRKFNRIENVFGDAIAEYRKYGIIAISHENIIHYPYKGQPGILSDPNMCEGVGRIDKLVLKGEEPVELSGRNVVRSKLTGIVVTSEDGKTTFTEGRDYVVIPGEIVFKWVVTFSQESGKFQIVRVPGGRIADGQTVVATYEHIGPDNSMMCLAEPEPKAEVARLAAAMVKADNLPFIALHASESAHCVGKGPRCQATGLTPSQLLANYYRDLDKAVKEANPKCRILAWTDDFMPWQNAPASGLGDVAKMMPKDAIMSTWYYGPGGTMDFNVKTARLWSGLGHDFTLMGWYDYANIRETAAVALWARQNGMSCLGTSSWGYPSAMLPDGDTSFLDETARCAWRVPRKGEVGFVDVNAALKKKGLGDGG